MMKVLKNNLDKIINFLIIIYLLSVYILCPKAEYLLYSHIILMIVLLLIIIYMYLKKSFHFNLSLFILMLFSLVSSLSIVWSIDPQLSMIRAKTTILLFIMLFFIYNFYYIYGKDKLLKNIAISGMIFSIYIIFYQGVLNFINAISNGLRIGAGVDNVNTIGVELAFASIFGFYYGIINKKKLFVIGSILPLAVSLATGSKKILLIIIVSLIFLILYLFEKISNKKKLIGFLITIILILFFSFFFVFNTLNSRVSKFFTTITNLDENNYYCENDLDKCDVSTYERVKFYEIGISYFLNKPILGYGIGTSSIITYKEIGRKTYFHSNYIELLFSVGIIGTILYYYIYYILIKSIIVNFKKNKKNKIFYLTLISCLIIIDLALVSYLSKMTYIYLCYLIINDEKFIEQYILKFIRKILNRVVNLRVFKIVSDSKYLKLKYKIIMGYKLNLNDPQTFNEKLQWLKLYDRNPEYTKMVDKYEVRKYIKEKIGENYLIPIIGIYDMFHDINFDLLPNKFVLKCTHDSGSSFICKNKRKLNINELSKKITKSLQKNYYFHSREWPYKNIKPRIIIEQYMEDKITKELRDYKFFAFNGEVKILYIATDRQKKGEDTKFDFFDIEFNHLNIKNGHDNAKITPEKPKLFNQMIEITKILSEGIPQVRIDFYEVNGKVYVGEITFFHWSGFVPFEPEEWDYKLGEMIKLPNIKQ